MKIGMEFRDRGISGIDFTDIQSGNPGCGGTQFEFALLAHHLLKLNKGYEIVFFHFNDNSFEEGIKAVKVEAINDIPMAAKEENVDILLFWSTHDDEWYKNLNDTGIKAIAWSHNFLTYGEIKNIAACSNVKKTVSVSREQYELLCGEEIFKNSTYIENIFDFVPIKNDRAEALNENIVCILGTIIKAKGFHILAREWKSILKAVPNAKLYVMGTASLYDQNMKLGSYGLAEDSYEKLFMPYLTDEKGEILPSVHFMGNVGAEKSEFFRKCKVGVVNPTGVETFCISALEMEAEGVPVCSKYLNGLIDTVVNGKTGFLFKNKSDFRKNIITLLSDNELNLKMGREAVLHAQKFSGESLVKEWDTLFNDVLRNENNLKKEFCALSLSRAKWLRYTVGRLRRCKILRFLPTPYKLELGKLQLKRFIVKIRNFILH